MNIEEMRQYEWSVSWSGGKDSTATIILMHEYQIPIKEIIYVRMMFDEELPATLPVMTDFVNGAIETFEGWGYSVKVVPSCKTAMEMASVKYKRSKHSNRNGKPYGITAFVRGFCNFSTIKTKTINSISNSNYEMVGYASDELNRLHRLNDTKCSIMAELGVTEAEAYDICRKYNLLSPLYELGFTRDGCWFYPNATKKQREYLKQNYLELVEKIKALIDMCGYDLASITNRNNWLKDLSKDREKHE